MKVNNIYEALFMGQAWFLGAFTFVTSFNPQNNFSQVDILQMRRLGFKKVQ